VDHAGIDEHAIARLECALLLVQPLLDLTLDHIDHLFLLRMLVKRMSAARRQGNFDHGQGLCTGIGRPAAPSQAAPIELLAGQF